MKPPIEYRTKGTIIRHVSTAELIGLAQLGEADAILRHKRALKAAQMRRYRAKKAGK